MEKTPNYVSKLGLGVASIFTAFTLWLVVHNLDRSSATFRVPITYDHPSEVLILSGSQVDVELRVLATKPRLRTLQASDFEVRVTNAEGRTGPLLVLLDAEDVSRPFGVSVQQVLPSHFSVSYDQRVNRLVPVEVAIVGEPATGYQVAREEVSTRPPEVLVGGPESAFVDELTVPTELVDVTGASTAVSASGLALVPPAIGLTLQQDTRVQTTIPIHARRGRRTIENVNVRVIRDRWQTSPPNPRQLTATVEGPEPELAVLTTDDLELTVDASDLEPRPDRDYFLDVSAAVSKDRCPSCQVISLSQSKVHVNVKRTATTTSRSGPRSTTPAASRPARAPGDSRAAQDASDHERGT